MMKSLIATMTVLPGKEEHVKKMFEKLAPQVRAEKGNVRFVPYISEEDPSKFICEETYINEQGFKDHIASQHRKDFDAELADYVKDRKSFVHFLNPIVEDVKH